MKQYLRETNSNEYDTYDLITATKRDLEKFINANNAEQVPAEYVESVLFQSLDKQIGQMREAVIEGDKVLTLQKILYVQDILTCIQKRVDISDEQYNFQLNKFREVANDNRDPENLWAHLMRRF